VGVPHKNTNVPTQVVDQAQRFESKRHPRHKSPADSLPMGRRCLEDTSTWLIRPWPTTMTFSGLARLARCMSSVNLGQTYDKTVMTTCR
jgi:hypothetical protein